MIEMIILNTPKPLRQQGIITVFKRRNPSHSFIPIELKI